MTSIILRTATRYLFVPLVVYSVYLLLRGHHLPGGGFVGGLMVGSAFALYALAFDVAAGATIATASMFSASYSGHWIVAFGISCVEVAQSAVPGSGVDESCAP